MFETALISTKTLYIYSTVGHFLGAQKSTVKRNIRGDLVSRPFRWNMLAHIDVIVTQVTLE